jgi:hypothetical protein
LRCCWPAARRALLASTLRRSSKAQSEPSSLPMLPAATGLLDATRVDFGGPDAAVSSSPLPDNRCGCEIFNWALWAPFWAWWASTSTTGRPSRRMASSSTTTALHGWPFPFKRLAGWSLQPSSSML